jgi:Phage integrase family
MVARLEGAVTALKGRRVHERTCHHNPEDPAGTLNSTRRTKCRGHRSGREPEQHEARRALAEVTRRNERPKRTSEEWARKVWVNLRGRAGVSSRVRFHDLRHTFASILISNGASAVELAEQLGDSVEVALSTYASLFGRVESEAKLRRILEHSYPPAPSVRYGFRGLSDMSGDMARHDMQPMPRRLP